MKFISVSDQGVKILQLRVLLKKFVIRKTISIILAIFVSMIIAINLYFYINNDHILTKQNEESPIWHATQIEYDALNIATLIRSLYIGYDDDDFNKLTFYFQSIRSRIDASREGLLKDNFLLLKNSGDLLRQISETTDILMLDYKTYMPGANSKVEQDLERLLRLCRRFSSYVAFENARQRDLRRLSFYRLTISLYLSLFAVVSMLAGFWYFAYKKHINFFKNTSSIFDYYSMNPIIFEQMSGFLYDTPINVYLLDDVEGFKYRTLLPHVRDERHILGIRLDVQDSFEFDPVDFFTSMAVNGSLNGTLKIKRYGETYSEEYYIVKAAKFRSPPFRYVAVVIDVTNYEMERDNHERQKSLIQMGELAGSLAHEISQPINNIALLVANLRFRSVDVNSEDLHVRNIKKEVGRCREIITALNSLSSGEIVDTEIVNLSIALENVRHQYRNASRNRVHIVIIEPIHEICIDFNYIILNRVLSNLIDNAIEKFSDIQNNYSIVLLKTEMRKDFVTIQVFDNAGGVDVELGSRIFDPFVSSKVGMGGTGLGLTIARKFVRQVDGDLTYRRRRNGTIFEVKLPIVDRTRSP